MPPDYIHDVTEFERVIKLKMTHESLFLDFKSTIDNWKLPEGSTDRGKLKEEAQKELCRDVVQFANTDGGCLLIGVSEQKNIDGIKVADSVTRVDEPDKMREWIEEAIKNYCVPSTFSKEISIVHVPNGPVVAVNVQPSLHTVYISKERPDKTRPIEIIGRTSHGKKYLNPNELERHIMDGSRAVRLKFEAALTSARSKDVVLIGGVMQRALGGVPVQRTIPGWKQVKCGPIEIHEHDNLSLQLSIPVEGPDKPLMLNVPYDLIRACWVDVAGRLNLLLYVRAILEFHADVIRLADGLD